MNAEALLEILRKGVKRLVGDESRIAVAYSGGIDSSIIAAIAGEFASVECYTCSVDGSFDALNAVQRGQEEGLNPHQIVLGPERLPAEVAAASHAIDDHRPVPIAYTIPILMVIEESKERLVLAGSGADELFGGYSKYLSLKDPEAAMAIDLQKMSHEVHRFRTWTAEIGKRLELPFLDESVVRFARTVPLSDKIEQSERKVILKDVAKLLGLPSDIRPKRAAQYSSGVLRLMQKTAKQSGVSPAEWTRQVISAARRSP